MRQPTYLRVATVLAAAGTLFSGYLSMVRLTSGVCALDEPCPFFLGYPACYTGFILFGSALWISLVALASKARTAWPLVVNGVIAATGVLFARAMVATELQSNVHYRLGLSTCSYGLIFFLALLGLSIYAGIRRRGGERSTRATSPAPGQSHETH